MHILEFTSRYAPVVYTAARSVSRSGAETRPTANSFDRPFDQASSSLCSRLLRHQRTAGRPSPFPLRAEVAHAHLRRSCGTGSVTTLATITRSARKVTTVRGVRNQQVTSTSLFRAHRGVGIAENDPHEQLVCMLWHHPPTSARSTSEVIDSWRHSRSPRSTTAVVPSHSGHTVRAEPMNRNRLSVFGASQYFT